MKLYIARHGQTNWNVEEKICGMTNIELNETGIEQAKNLAKYIKDNEIKIDKIIVSPLKRAQQTAAFISEVVGVKPETDDRLREQNYGKYEGINRWNEGFLNNKRNFAYRYPGGESMMDVCHRVYSLLEEVKANYEGQIVLLVAHGGACRLINTYFEDLTNEEFFHWEMKNAQLIEYEL